MAKRRNFLAIFTIGAQVLVVDPALAKNVIVVGPCKCETQGGSVAATYTHDFCVSNTAHDMCSQTKRACKADAGNVANCTGLG